MLLCKPQKYVLNGTSPTFHLKHSKIEWITKPQRNKSEVRY